MTLPINERSVNQTSAGFLKGLFASFELSRQTLGTDPPVQLAIWSTALAERLRKLQKYGEKESNLKMVLALTVVDHDWKVYYSYATDDGERVSFGHRPCHARRKTDHQCRSYTDRIFWGQRRMSSVSTVS